MASIVIYVLIRKVQNSETDSHVNYTYGPSEDRMGELRISKSDGAIDVVTQVPGTTNDPYTPRAKRKLFVHWQNGRFPDKTCWAS